MYISAKYKSLKYVWTNTSVPIMYVQIILYIIFVIRINIVWLYLYKH